MQRKAISVTIMTDIRYLQHTVELLEGFDWILVGGSVAEQYCSLFDIDYDHSTQDVDITVNSKDGFTPATAMDRLMRSDLIINNIDDPGERFIHRVTHPDGWHIDVMQKDYQQRPKRFMGKEIFACPGSKSALGVYRNGRRKEIVTIELSSNHCLNMPNLWSAIAMKGLAYRKTTLLPERHVQDAIALLACAGAQGEYRELTNSERRAVNFIFSSSLFSDLDIWSAIQSKYWLGIVHSVEKVRGSTAGVILPDILK